MDYIDLRIEEDPVVELVYKYKINPRIHEWLLGDVSIFAIHHLWGWM